MTPRDRFTLALDAIPALSASERAILRAAADEYAAAMIERHALPPLEQLAARTGQQGGAA